MTYCSDDSGYRRKDHYWNDLGICLQCGTTSSLVVNGQQSFATFAKLMREMANHVSSNPTFCKKSPNFKVLMEMKDAIPFACLFLEESPHEVFAMLYDLVPPEKQPPDLPAYYRGRIPMYQEMWKYWALHEGYLKTCYNVRGYWVEDKYGNRADWH